MKDIKKRQALEQKVVRHLIRTAKRHDWTAVYVDDGEDRIRCRTEAEVMDAVFAVDDSTIRFQKTPLGPTHCAVIVLGNDGYDAIADCSMGEGWDEVMKEVDAYVDTLQT